MVITKHIYRGVAAAVLLALSVPATAQMMKVQCPTSTTLHPYTDPSGNNPAPSLLGTGMDTVKGGTIKCQQISGGDGYATMADGTQTYLFGFGPLSGLDLISAGLPGTQAAVDFMKPFNAPNYPGTVPNNHNAVVPNPLYDSTKKDTNPNGAFIEPAGMVGAGVLAAQQPAPLIAIDEDDELFLTLSNVGMIMRPDLFEQHTVHFHGYPNASSYFDGVPDASVAISISGSMTYYYTAPDAGTYFWHCHITPPEHLQMGMVGQLYVRPRQNQVAAGDDMRAALIAQNAKIDVQKGKGATNGLKCSDILCTGQTPVPMNIKFAAREAASVKYAYNDGDGSTAYDKEYPIQMMGFDPAFHFVGMTFNPEDFSGMKDKYFMLSGRGYPDTVNAAPITTQASDGVARPTQVIPTKIQLTSCTTNCANVQHRALLRISDLSVTEYSTLATIGIPMKVIAVNARLLRDESGYNLSYLTNSVTMGGGESTDVILDAQNVPPGTYFLYSTNLDHLSNDAENFGGMMTEIEVL